MRLNVGLVLVVNMIFEKEELLQLLKVFSDIDSLSTSKIDLILKQLNNTETKIQSITEAVDEIKKLLDKVSD